MAQESDRNFRRSSFCSLGACVEVAAEAEDGAVYLRDSARPTEVVRFTSVEWDAFVRGVKAGEFDFPA